MTEHCTLLRGMLNNHRSIRQFTSTNQAPAPLPIHPSVPYRSPIVSKLTENRRVNQVPLRFLRQTRKAYWGF